MLASRCSCSLNVWLQLCAGCCCLLTWLATSSHCPAFVWSHCAVVFASRGVQTKTDWCPFEPPPSRSFTSLFCGVACAGQVPEGLHRQRHHVRRHQRGASRVCALLSPTVAWEESCVGCCRAASTPLSWSRVNVVPVFGRRSYLATVLCRTVSDGQRRLRPAGHVHERAGIAHLRRLPARCVLPLFVGTLPARLFAA